MEINGYGSRYFFTVSGVAVTVKETSKKADDGTDPKLSGQNKHFMPRSISIKDDTIHNPAYS